MIEKRGTQWCLLTSDGSKVLGCHDTKDGAEAQERAIQARTHAEGLHELRGVEIFEAGEWNGDTYGVADLDEMVRAAQEVGFTPPIKAGHEDGQGQPALGWVENLRRVGSKLFADLVALPKAVYEAIKQRRYDRVSAEIFWNLERNGKTFPKALKALALLGAEVPAVDLKPLSAYLSIPPMPGIPAGSARGYAVTLELEGGRVTTLSIEQVETLCPPCARSMRRKGLTALKITRRADGTYEIPGGMSEASADALCEKFGGSEGFITRCVDSMTMMDEPGAFCNALKDYCHGLSQKGADRRRVEMEKDEQIRTLTAKITELEAALAAKKTAAGEVVTTAMYEKLQADLKTSADRLAALQEDRRQERLVQKVAALRIPALRPFCQALYDVATGGAAKTYAIRVGDKDIPMTPEQVMDAFVADLNKSTEPLFRVLSTTSLKRDDTPADENPRKEADRRARAYLVDKKLDPVKDYATALHAVLDQDPDLKRAYAES